MLFFILILIIAAAAALARQIRIVPHQMTYVIERFGKYYDTWEDGLHVKMPIADRIVKKVSKKERVYDFPPQDVITKDNVTISIDSVVYASVFDPQSYTYSIDNPILGLQNLTATTLRSIIGSMELDQTLSSRSEINQHMRTVLDEATDGWGIRVSRVEVKNIKPPAEIEEVMTKQMRAERERRQTVLEARLIKSLLYPEQKEISRQSFLQQKLKEMHRLPLQKDRLKQLSLYMTLKRKVSSGLLMLVLMTAF